ncbi:hypothetical protein KQI52_13530 [bacterium]|nr:hypothetical protein [bacterium]
MNPSPTLTNWLRIPAALLLAAYLLVTGTLDLHHNHGSVDCDGSGVCESGQVPDTVVLNFTEAGDTAPCPVLQFTLSHAPGPPPVLDAIRATFSLYCQFETDEPLVASINLPSPRAPPFA